MPIGQGMTLTRLGRLVQRRLKLTDWQVEFAEGSLKDTKGGFGLCSYYTDKKFAQIVVLSQRFRRGMRPNETIEQTIFHELLHLHFAPFVTRSRLSKMLVEQSIDAIAKCRDLTLSDTLTPGVRRRAKHLRR